VVASRSLWPGLDGLVPATAFLGTGLLSSRQNAIRQATFFVDALNEPAEKWERLDLRLAGPWVHRPFASSSGLIQSRRWGNYRLLLDLVDQYIQTREIQKVSRKALRRIQEDLEHYKLYASIVASWDFDPKDPNDAWHQQMYERWMKQFRSVLRIEPVPFPPALFWLTLLLIAQHGIRLSRCAHPTCGRYFLDLKNRRAKYHSRRCGDANRQWRAYQRKRKRTPATTR
jgi:hypothetical protein